MSRTPTLRLVRAVMHGSGCRRAVFARGCQIHRSWTWNEAYDICSRAEGIAQTIASDIPEVNQP